MERRPGQGTREETGRAEGVVEAGHLQRERQGAEPEVGEAQWHLASPGSACL